jgi:chromosome partitioning protein
VELGHRVLLIDLDPQAHLTLSIRTKPEQLTHTVGDLLMTNASLSSVSYESSVHGLYIVPANQELTSIDKLLYERQDYGYLLRNSLQTMKGNDYNFVLIDCPPTLGALTLNALTAADLMIIPTPCEYYTAQSLRRVIDITKLIREKTNSRLNYQVLVTMYDRRNRISRFMLNQMQQELTPILFETIIEVDTKFKESPVFGQPITFYAPKTRGTRQYRSLAKELTNHEP